MPKKMIIRFLKIEVRGNKGHQSNEPILREIESNPNCIRHYRDELGYYGNQVIILNISTMKIRNVYYEKCAYTYEWCI